MMETKKPLQDGCFRRLAGMDRVFEPKSAGHREGKRHPCPDCSFCQNCAETRCLACRRQGERGSAALQKRLSFKEQILLYEKVNAEVSEAE
ncbi:MAG TPA: hypothetical protein PKV86_04275 [Syntrophobacteraceae bacterium]|nr:hypothetical protein [Syntrophobacteraceae bacterium]